MPSLVWSQRPDILERILASMSSCLPKKRMWDCSINVIHVSELLKERLIIRLSKATSTLWRHSFLCMVEGRMITPRGMYTVRFSLPCLADPTSPEGRHLRNKHWASCRGVYCSDSLCNLNFGLNSTYTVSCPGYHWHNSHRWANMSFLVHDRVNNIYDVLTLYLCWHFLFPRQYF